MPHQALALIVLQKRMLDDDLWRRTIAIAATGIAALYFLTPLQVAAFLASTYAADLLLTALLTRLVAQPHSVMRLRLVQGAAFLAMSTYLSPALMLWQLPGSTPKVAAMMLIFGGMLSVMLVRTAFRPMTIANSLPLAGVVMVLAAKEGQDLPTSELTILGFGVAVLTVYFVTTLIMALRNNRNLALARDEALARVETQKRFLATMSHELRTPLNGILGMAQVLASRHPGEGAEIIRDSARDMAAMVDDLLDNAAIEAGSLRINRKATQLSHVLDRITERWQPAFADKGLALHVVPSSDLPQAAMIDVLRLSQCLSNLLANALRLTDQGGVTLELKPHQIGLEAVVTDTGPGMPEGVEARLFRPFEPIELPGPAFGPSTGLGLSITRGLAIAMGGDLQFARPAQGGSCFRLTLAAPEVQISPPQTQTAVQMSVALPIRRVLVVDDIATNRLVLRLLLAAEGMDVVEALSGEHALGVLSDPAAVPPDVVLMDIRMPGMSGFEVLAHMRAAGLKMPVVAVSADAAPAERDEAMAQGFDGYLTKPVEEAGLRRVLAQAMGGPRRL